MAIVKCKECGEPISSQARVCPKCGVKRPKQVGIIGFIVVVVVCILIYQCTRNAVYPELATVGAGVPQLRLDSFHCAHGDGTASITGSVTNISTEQLDAVWVVGEFDDAKGNTLASDTDAIELRPLLPGQSSPFTILSIANNPAIKKCGISGFTHALGSQIAWRSK